jgi:hypothetical protein
MSLFFRIVCLANPYEAYISIFDIKREKSSNKMRTKEERIALVDGFFFGIYISIVKRKSTRIARTADSCVLRIINRL